MNMFCYQFDTNMAPVPWTTEQNSKTTKSLCKMRKTWKNSSTLKNPNTEYMDELGKVRSYVSHWETWNFKPIMNSLHTAELLAIGKALNKNIDY